MINRSKFTTYTYNNYAKIAPAIKGDKTGFFHYYILNEIMPNDKYISVEGYDNNYTYEYIYGKCNEENMEGFENIIANKTKFLTYGYCIKKSVRLSDGNITLVNDKNFVWPVIAEGRNFYYFFLIKKCSIKPNSFTGEVKECGSEEEINEYFKNVEGGTLYILDNYIDVGIYKNLLFLIFIL